MNFHKEEVKRLLVKDLLTMSKQLERDEVEIDDLPGILESVAKATRSLLSDQ